jgi:hypothetical protein
MEKEHGEGVFFFFPFLGWKQKMVVKPIFANERTELLSDHPPKRCCFLECNIEISSNDTTMVDRPLITN